MSKRKNIKTYFDAVRFIESLSNISASDRKNKPAAGERLANAKKFLAFLGNPQNKFKIIHIAGTSGKGSVSAMLQSVLSSAGRIAGLYTSPHTTTYCERIRVGGKYISEKELVSLVEFLKNKMDAFAESAPSLGFFEFTFCLAVMYFARKKCEYAVVETGMGGRYDATNAVKKPAYAIITNIGRDHLEAIGPTLRDVAREKAGIIKKSAPALTGERRKSLLKIFARETKNLRVADYKEIKNPKTGLDGAEFEYKGEKYKLKLLGEHQIRNAVLAIECARDLGVAPRFVKKGLASVFYPARLEAVSKKPLIIIDGAHNEDKLEAAMDFLKGGKYRIKYLILASARNKEIDRAARGLAGYFDKIYLTRFSSPFRKCRSFGEWKKIFSGKARKKLRWFHLAEDALLDILPRLRHNDLLMVTGSIFLAGELREHWRPETEIIKFRKSEL